MNQRKLGVILSYIVLVINAVVGFAYVPLLLGLLGESEYGLYQLMGSLIAYLSIMDFGMSSTIIRYYSHYRSLDDQENAENSLALSSIIYGVITVIILVAGAVLFFNIESIFGASLKAGELESAKWIFLVQLVNIAFTIPSKIFDAVIISHERFVFLKGATIIQTVLTPIAAILILRGYPFALCFVIVQAVFNLLLIAVKALYSFGVIKVKIRLHHFSAAIFREMLGFSFFVFLAALMDQLFWNTNKVILGIVATTAEVALYGIAMTVFNAYMSISTVITSVFLPRVTAITNQENRDSELSALFIRIGRIQYLLLSCVLSGFVLFGRQFVDIWSGKSQAYLITLCLIVPFTIDLIQNIGITILQAEKKMVFRSISFLIGAAVNIGVSTLAAIYFGVVGCALATGLMFFLMNVVLNIYYAKKIHLQIGSFWREIGKMTLPCLLAMIPGVGIMLLPLGSGIVSLGVRVLMYLVVFVPVMWLFALNDYEKGLAKMVLTRFIKKRS